MSLRTFHLVFITVSALLGLFLAAWGFLKGEGLYGMIGILLLLLLIPYGLWFRNKMKIIPLLLTASIFHSLPADACAVCFKDPNSPLTKGIIVGVLFLGAVVGGVLGGIAGVAVTWGRRSRRQKNNA